MKPGSEETAMPDDPFFRRTDSEVAGPPREIAGYGEHPPRVRWRGANGTNGEAKVAIQLVVNYEEGSEKTFAMGDNVNDILYELPFALEGQRAHTAGLPVPFFAAAVALERNPEVAAKLASRGDEPAGHGYRWSNHFEMTRDQEREAIRLATASIESTTGTRPVGWYCREMSP